MGSSWNHFAVSGQAHALRQPEFADLLFDFRPHRSLPTIQLRADGGGNLSADEGEFHGSVSFVRSLSVAIDTQRHKSTTPGQGPRPTGRCRPRALTRRHFVVMYSRARP